MTSDERKRLKMTGTNIPEAYDYVLRSREQIRLDSKDGNVQAQALLNRAIDLDPCYATAYANLAITQLLNYVNRWSETAGGSLEDAYELAEKAVALMSNGKWDAPLLEELGRTMADASICGLGQAAANPLFSVLKHFREEVV